MGTEAERLSAARGKEEQLLASDALQMPLAPGWEAIDDPGGTYYYNSTTGESSYDVPLPADEPDEPEAPAEAAAAAGPAELMMAAAAAGKALAAAQRNLAEAAG